MSISLESLIAVLHQLFRLENDDTARCREKMMIHFDFADEYVFKSREFRPVLVNIQSIPSFLHKN